MGGFCDNFPKLRGDVLVCLLQNQTLNALKTLPTITKLRSETDSLHGLFVPRVYFLLGVKPQSHLGYSP